jgi:hypothetical protein
VFARFCQSAGRQNPSFYGLFPDKGRGHIAFMVVEVSWDGGVFFGRWGAVFGDVDPKIRVLACLVRIWSAPSSLGAVDSV